MLLHYLDIEIDIVSKIINERLIQCFILDINIMHRLIVKYKTKKPAANLLSVTYYLNILKVSSVNRTDRLFNKSGCVYAPRR